MVNPFGSLTDISPANWVCLGMMMGLWFFGILIAFILLCSEEPAKGEESAIPSVQAKAMEMNKNKKNDEDQEELMKGD